MRSKTREKIWSLTHGLTPPEAVAYCPISGPGVASVNSIWALCVNSVNSGRGMCIGGGWAISRQLIQGGPSTLWPPENGEKRTPEARVHSVSGGATLASEQAEEMEISRG